MDGMTHTVKAKGKYITLRNPFGADGIKTTDEQGRSHLLLIKENKRQRPYM